MAGAMSTVAGNGEAGFADGADAAVRFNRPIDLVVDGEGVIVVADRDNHRLRKIVGGQLLVAETGRKDTLRVVEASLAPPLWMGPVEKAAEESEAAMPAKAHAALLTSISGRCSCRGYRGDFEGRGAGDRASTLETQSVSGT
jgi:hypothetical protein